MKKAAIRIRTAAFTQIVNLYEPFFAKTPNFARVMLSIVHLLFYATRKARQLKISSSCSHILCSMRGIDATFGM